MKISPRTLGRVLAVQSLYGAAFSGLQPLEVLERVAGMGGPTLLRYRFDEEEILSDYVPAPHIPLSRRSAEQAKQYARELLSGVSAHVAMIDPLIENHLIGWSKKRVGQLEWAILQTAVCEMIFLRAVDPPVAIDQAITITKWLGREESARFVNGVLDAIVRSAGNVESGAVEHERPS